MDQDCRVYPSQICIKRAREPFGRCQCPFYRPVEVAYNAVLRCVTGGYGSVRTNPIGLCCAATLNLRPTAAVVCFQDLGLHSSDASEAPVKYNKEKERNIQILQIPVEYFKNQALSPMPPTYTLHCFLTVPRDVGWQVCLLHFNAVLRVVGVVGVTSSCFL